MKSIRFLLGLIVLLGNVTEAGSKQLLTKSPNPDTKELIVCFNEKTYNVRIEYRYENTTNFTFRSDKSTVFDCDNDGIVISGLFKDNQLSFYIIDTINAYSSRVIEPLSVTDKSISGSGTLVCTGTAKEFKATFKLLHN